MEVNFSKIVETTETLLEFLTVFFENYASHQNKYIRKFSVKAVSYLLTNIEDEQFREILTFVIQQEG